MELLTDLLDVLGLLLVAAGVCALVFPWLAWGGLVLSGVIVLAGSWFAARRVRVEARRLRVVRNEAA